MPLSNDNLRAIKDIDAKLAALAKILDRGEYLAAGVTIELSVGANAPEEKVIQLQLSQELEPVFAAVRNSLLLSREFRQSMAKRDLNELKQFFGESGVSAV